MIRVFFGVPESYGNSPGSIWALLGHTGIEERCQKEGGARPPLVRIGQGVQSPFPSPSPPLSFSPSPHTWRASSWPAAPSPLLLYIWGQGAPLDTTTIDRLIFYPCAVPPSTIVHLDNIIAVLRRSPASVEHHHRHHAVVLTKLSLNTRLDRSSRDVIELNGC